MATSPITGGSIDVNAIVSQLMTIERQPLARLQTNLTGVQTRLSELGKLQSALDKFRDASRNLTGLDTWRAAKATSSAPEIVDATAGSGALVGSYEVSVSALAQHQTLVTAPVASSDTVFGGGTLTITTGKVENGVFVPAPDGTPTAVVVPTGATLAQVRDAINGADAGIGASLVGDAQGARLMVRSLESGAEQAFAIAVNDDDGNSGDASGLSTLAYTPELAAAGVTRTQTASDAAFEVNGLALTNSGNRPDAAVEHLTLQLRQKTTAPIQVAVEIDATAIRKSVDDFVAAYNELNTLINSQTRYDAESKTAGPLQGDRSVLLIQGRLRDILRATVDGSPIGSLSDAGIQVQRDGSLLVNDTRFADAVADPAKLKALFAPEDPDPAKVGIARRFDTLIGDVLDLDGALTGATSTLRERQSSIQDQETRFNERLVQIEARLRRQYSGLDTTLSQLTSSLSALSQLPST